MNKKPGDQVVNLEIMFDSIAESFIDISDEGIFSAIKEEGRDVTVASARVRDLFAKADKKFRQKSLEEARALHKQHVSSLHSRPLVIQGSAADKRKWLEFALLQKPEMGRALTLQHREFSSVTDEEVDSYLRQLIELGVINLQELKTDTDD